jgi:hypothetical protein
MSDELCQKCGEAGEDRRTLWMCCFYDMSELGIPFEKKKVVDYHHFYTLRVCKDCRADWMDAIRKWYESPKITHNGCGSGIYIRECGAIKEITEAEFYGRQKEADKVRIDLDAEPETFIGE